MAVDDMRKVCPVWFNLSIAIHNDPEVGLVWSGQVWSGLALQLGTQRACTSSR